MAKYQKGGNDAVSTRPKTPTRPVTPKPFQRPPTTANRAAHLKYLDTHLDDYIERDVELTPSFIRSWRAYQKTTEPKILKSKLIQEREIAKAAADIEAARRKDGSGAWVQARGVLTKG